MGVFQALDFPADFLPPGFHLRQVFPGNQSQARAMAGEAEIRVILAEQ
jgi:hypothetical protein